MKTCRTCLVEKPRTDFGVDRHKNDGLNSRCKYCCRASAKDYAQKKRGTSEGRRILAERQRAYYARVTESPEGLARMNAESAARKREWAKYPANRERLREKSREEKRKLRTNPVGREKLNRHRAAFDRRHPGRANAKVARRRGRVAKATPVWANKSEIEKFYEACPEGMHVDHIIPLRGKMVSGLHVLCNLQYLNARENCSKGNRHD